MRQISLLIIGGGPIGLSCGIAAQEAGIDYRIIEKGCLVNSLHNFPNDMTFFSSSGKLEIGNIPFISLALRPSKQEALEYYRRVTQHFDLNIGLYESFETINKLSGPGNQFHVTTSKEEYTCNYIVNSTGFYDTPVLMNIIGEDLEKVQHYYNSAHHLFNQKVAIVGGSNSAVDLALEAFRKGAEVTLLVRGNAIGENVKYWIKPDFESRVSEGNIKVYFEADVQKFTDNAVHFNHKGKSVQIDNDFVYALTGYVPNFRLSKQLGIDIDPATGIPNYNPETMETNASGIYLAGVVCGGLNTRVWFIENTRDHGTKIINHIKKNQWS